MSFVSPKPGEFDIQPGQGVEPWAPLKKVIRLDEVEPIDISKISGHPQDQGLDSILIASFVNGSTDFHIGLYRMEVQQYHPLHFHPAGAEFYYVVDGECRITVDEDDVEAGAGTAIYLPRGTKHAIRTGSSPVSILYGFSTPDFRMSGTTWLE